MKGVYPPRKGSRSTRGRNAISEGKRAAILAKREKGVLWCWLSVNRELPIEHRVSRWYAGDASLSRGEIEERNERKARRRCRRGLVGNFKQSPGLA